MKSVFRRVGCIDVVGSVVCCVFVAFCLSNKKHVSIRPVLTLT